MTKLCFAGMLMVSACLLTWQAAICSPVYDGTAHLASGLAILRIGDFGYYRVNPPLHRLWMAAFVEAACNPELPTLEPASLARPSNRKEFDLGRQLIRSNPENFPKILFTARLCRIPIVLLGGWIVFGTVRLFSKNDVGALIGAMLWFSSPLLLGHGWTLLPDAFSTVAMAFLLFASLRWLEKRDWQSWMVAGLAWGIALSTKFSFCPVYLLWPVSLMIHQLAMREWGIRQASKLVASHVGHGFVALVVVWCAYGFDGVGVPFELHRLESDMLRAYGDQPDEEDRSPMTSFVRKLPSPLPEQFLVGVDTQKLDFDRGQKCYILGRWYETGPWWYYTVGYLIKEQTAAILGLLLIPIGLFFGSNMSRARRAAILFSLSIAVFFMIVLSWHSSMALNIRYAMPILPLLYVSIALSIPDSVQERTSRRSSRIRSLICWGVPGMVVAALAFAAPHFFSYTNPCFGGVYRTPPALHDSNFDWAQDVWIVRSWLSKREQNGDDVPTYIAMHSAQEVARFNYKLPTDELLERAIQQRSEVGKAGKNLEAELAIFRGLGIPAAWTRLNYPDGSEPNSPGKTYQELLSYRPDYFVTPTVAVYRVYADAP